MMIPIKDSVGNLELLQLSKTAFLSSRKIPASAVLKCYDWAIAQREAGNCVVSGFHSKLEKDVLHYLLKGSQPIVVALARGLKSNIEPKFKKPLEEGRLLIITPFDANVTRVTSETAAQRNSFMIDIADQVVVGYKMPGGLIDMALMGTKKKVGYLNDFGITLTNS